VLVATVRGSSSLHYHHQNWKPNPEARTPRIRICVKCASGVDIVVNTLNLVENPIIMYDELYVYILQQFSTLEL
jgi:hypothetical protein